MDLYNYCKKNYRFDLLNEFDFVKNYFEKDLLISDLEFDSTEEVFWRCKCGNEFKKSPMKACRNLNFINCPVCAANKNLIENRIFNNSSIMECMIYFYVKQVFPKALSGYKTTFYNKHVELDIFLENLNIVIEHDGHMHSLPEKIIDDTAKSTALNLSNIDVIRIRQNFDLNVGKDDVITYSYSNKDEDLSDLDRAIKSVFDKIKEKKRLDSDTLRKIRLLKINCNRDKYLVYKGLLDVKSEMSSQKDLEKEISEDKAISIEVKSVEKKIHPKSLARVNPRAAREFLTDKNGIGPEEVLCTSKESYWFKCEVCGQEYYQQANKRHGTAAHCKKK